MPLPEQLERLRQISIDTLDLSDSTSALLKWNGITHMLDCVAFFYEVTLYTYLEIIEPWPRHFTLLFDEVKPALITAGYWELVLDAEVWRALDKQKYYVSGQRFIQWQGQDQNLDEIPVEQLGLPQVPADFPLKSISSCIGYFLYALTNNLDFWLDLGTTKSSEGTADRPFNLNKYMLGVVQPRLVEMGYWRFVEDYLDDFIRARRFRLARGRLKRERAGRGDNDAAG